MVGNFISDLKVINEIRIHLSEFPDLHLKELPGIYW